MSRVPGLVPVLGYRKLTENMLQIPIFPAKELAGLLPEGKLMLYFANTVQLHHLDGRHMSHPAVIATSVISPVHSFVSQARTWRMHGTALEHEVFHTSRQTYPCSSVHHNNYTISPTTVERRIERDR